MTRDELKALGLEDEQIEKIMASHGKDIQSEKAKAEKFKEDAKKALDLQKQLDDLNNQNLSDIEKANKIAEDAKAETEGLKATIAKMEQMQELAKLGIVGEQAEALMKDGKLDFATLGQIISDREKAAATAKEDEIANNSTNPGGGSVGNPDADEKTEAEKIATEIGKSLGGADKTSSDIISSYL